MGQYARASDEIFKIRIGAKQKGPEPPELVVLLSLALRQSSCVAFSWRRIFFP
jgi:hypothetical protein